MRHTFTRIIGLLSLVLPSLHADGGLDRAIRLADWSDPLGGRLAVADFDRDQKADAAVLLRPQLFPPAGGYRVEVHFSGRPSLGFTIHSSAGAVGVTARDIDNDHDSDLVVEQSFTAKGVQVWINDGQGGFQEGRLEDYPDLDNEEPLTLRTPWRTSRCLAGIRQTSRSDSYVAVSSGAVLCPPDGRGLSGTQVGRGDLRARIYRWGPTRAPPSVSVR